MIESTLERDPVLGAYERTEAIIAWIRSRNGCPELPPQYDVAEMHGGSWGIYHDDEHTISFPTRDESVDGAWGSWLYDLGDEWADFILSLIGCAEPTIDGAT